MRFGVRSIYILGYILTCKQTLQLSRNNDKQFFWNPSPHPLAPLRSDEIRQSSNIIKAEWLNSPSILFITIDLLEPSKKQMRSYEAGKNSLIGPRPPRKSISVILDRAARRSYEVTVNLDTSELVAKELGPGVQPLLTYEDTAAAQRAIDGSQEFLDRVKELGFQDTAEINFDVWGSGHYSYFHPELKNVRIVDAYISYRAFKEDNEFAHPLNFYTIVDVFKEKVIRLYDLPVYANTSLAKPHKNLLPSKNVNYDPAILGKGFYRKDVRPLRTSSESGPSFTLNNDEVSWQKFKFRIGFNTREAVVLYGISYDKRPLMYRAALSEMLVFYGDPRPPFQEKTTFDAGEYGLGLLARPLKKNVDCFKDGRLLDVLVHTVDTGEPVRKKNVICVHEEDGGMLHMHTTEEGSRTAARGKVLVVHFFVTVSNYDYGFFWKFHQDATISYEVLLTGLVSTNWMLERPPYATIVSPGIGAQYHQHIFNVRMDTMFDGETNTVSTFDVLRVPDADNPYGQGITTRDTVLRTSTEGTTDTNVDTDRTWKISNPSSFNPITKEPVAWKLIPNNQQLLLSKEGSRNWKRAQFATHAVWVTKYRQGERHAGGDYPNQGKGGEGLPKWAGRNDSILGTDIVLWHSFGTTHIPRVEDFPLMGAEKLGFTLKPFNFFTAYPGLDVPPIPDT